MDLGVKPLPCKSGGQKLGQQTVLSEPLSPAGLPFIPLEWTVPAGTSGHIPYRPHTHRLLVSFSPLPFLGNLTGTPMCVEEETYHQKIFH